MRQGEFQKVWCFFSFGVLCFILMQHSGAMEAVCSKKYTNCFAPPQAVPSGIRSLCRGIEQLEGTSFEKQPGASLEVIFKTIMRTKYTDKLFLLHGLRER